MAPKRDTADTDEAAFVAAWSSGERLLDIGARFGIAKTTVSARAARMGLPPRYRRAGSVRAELHDPIGLHDGRWVVRRGVQRWVPSPS